METGFDYATMTRVGRMVTVSGHIKVENNKPSLSGRLAIDLSYSGDIPLPANKTGAFVWLNSFETGLIDPVMAYLDDTDCFIYIDRYSAGFVQQDVAEYLDSNSEAIFSVTYSV